MIIKNLAYVICLSLGLLLLSFAGCKKGLEHTSAKGSGPKLPRTGAKSPAGTPEKEFSGLAFLDRSLYVVRSADFYTYPGQVIRSASFYPSSDSVLVLVSPTTIDPSIVKPGRLVVISLKEPYDLYELKGGKQVISFRGTGDHSGAFITSVQTDLVVAGTSGNDDSESGEPLSNDKLIKGGVPSAPNKELGNVEDSTEGAVGDLKVSLFSLDSEGKLSDLSIENAEALGIFAGGKLLLRRFKKLTPENGGFKRVGPISYTLTSLNDPSVDLAGFDFEPILSPGLKFALRVHKVYDVVDYSNSVFSVFLSPIRALRKNGEKGAVNIGKERLLYTAPFFLTLREERWDPQVLFLDDENLLITTFSPEDSAGVKDQAYDNDLMSFSSMTSGRLSLERFKVSNQERNVLIETISPYLKIYYTPKEQVFFGVYRDDSESGTTHRVVAVSINAKHTRTVYKTDNVDGIEIADVNYPTGSLIVLERMEGESGLYSRLIHLRLSRTAPVEGDAKNAERTSSGDTSVSESGEPTKKPPPIHIPGSPT